MRRQGSLLLLLLLAWPLQAQTPHLGQALPTMPAPSFDGSAPPLIPNCSAEPQCANNNGFLTGNHNFPNFINWVSNPLENIDPRAVTAIYPIFGSAWITTPSALPDGDFQIYGPAITVALSERLAIGLNQGGYAVSHFSRDQSARIVNDPRFAGLRPDLQARLRDIASGGERDGFLNMGGFVQYTLIEDVPNQFLLTGGVRLEVPCGANEVFQGYGPAEMAPYLTVGKEFGEFHLLATTAYEFPIGPGNDNQQIFMLNVHLDRRCFGWLYPLVEVNALYHVTSVGFGLDTRRDFVDFGNFESSGNVVTLAVGANAVLVPEHLEIGAVYTTVIASQGNLDANSLLVKMVLRY
jgi:hypothetical protein